MTISLKAEIGNNFCYAPWTNIHINTTGTYKTCCAGTEEIGDLRIIPIQDLLSNKKLFQIKESLYQNKNHVNCTICTRQEQHSSVSERTWYNNIANFESIKLNDLHNQNLQNLDIRWSNTCNLSCVYCDHEASSQWAILKKQPVERLDYSQTLPNILKFIESHKATIKNLALLGGEPLLQKENEDLLEIISNDVNINVITNLSVPLEKNKIFNKLLSKNNVMWDISFETIEDRFEYVRHGSSWNLILNNLQLLAKITKDKQGHNIGVTSQYSIYNALNLSSLHEFFKTNNLPNIRWNELHYPAILSVVNLPHAHIIEAMTELENSTKYHHMPVQQKFLKDMYQTLQSIKSTRENCDELNEWHKKQEDTYWPNTKLRFYNLWKEYN